MSAKKEKLMKKVSSTTYYNYLKLIKTYFSALHFAAEDQPPLQPGPNPKKAPARKSSSGTKPKQYIPPPLKKSVPNVNAEVLKKCALVFFDVETTGLAVGRAEIIQMSAKHGEQTFNCFVKPKRAIKKETSDLTGITMTRGRMYHNGLAVNSMNSKDALVSFLEFLESVNGNVILVAHNAPFDMKFTLLALEVNSLADRFAAVCIGFADTLSLANQIVPPSQHGPINNKLGGLLEFFFGKVDVVLHDSANDVLALEAIFYCLSESFEQLQPHAFLWSEYRKYKNCVARAKGTHTKILCCIAQTIIINISLT
jgi:DNA polymerase III alpha subunit (gram-positive type)